MTSYECLDRFWDKVKVGDHLDCWPWVGALDRRGRIGAFNVIPATISANRLAWMLYYGERLPDHFRLARQCYTPTCVNPMHWAFIGTEGRFWNRVLKGPPD